MPSGSKLEPRRRGKLVEQAWEPRPDALGGRRARSPMRFRAYVPAPIGRERFVLDAASATKAAAAEVACREMGGSESPLVHFDPLARQLLRAESVASSRIEGLLLSHRRLARAAFAPSARDLTAESVLANIDALEHAVELGSSVERLTTEHLLEIHRCLFAGGRDERLGGLIRDQQNWIGGEASSPRNAEFIPPPHDGVADLLDDLASFCNREDVPAVIQAAIAHAQFETIHPFHDGNGRAGRALILVVLRKHGLVTAQLPPVSLALAADADRYIAGLTSWRNDNEPDWYEVFSDAVARAAQGARDFGARIANLQERWLKEAGEPRRGSGARRLIEILPSNPVIDVKSASRLIGGAEERARQAIQRLEIGGVLKRTSVGKRRQAWETVGLFDLLDDFERDVGSR